uniref:RNA binding motif protein 45 n=1 Tax=Eptatretus burgeri TaxID=7764 RepID=A0A8C4Q762_EPTBU
MASPEAHGDFDVDVDRDQGRDPDNDNDDDGFGGPYRNFNRDDPPNSRLFLMVNKATKYRQLWDLFEQFGEIQDIRVLKDRDTQESKGLAYVKFSKASQACRAMEELNGKKLRDGKPMKILIAQSRTSHTNRDLEDAELTRIFVMIPKNFTENDLTSNFEEFGEIEYCNVLRDKSTGESKGYGYVRFMRPSQAALAIENSDRRFRAILAEPKYRLNPNPQGDWHQPPESMHANFGYDPCFQGVPPIFKNMGPKTLPLPHFDDFGCHPGPPLSNLTSDDSLDFSRWLSVTMDPCITREQLTALFGLIPGLDFCDAQKDVINSCRLGYVRYNNPASAIYAKEKLNQFEYPPGSPMMIHFAKDVEAATSGENPLRLMALQLVTAQVMAEVSSHFTDRAQPGRGQMVQPQMMQSTQQTRHANGDFETSFTTARLPPKQPLAPMNTPMKERLFVVCSSSAPPPPEALTNAFCRFGNLIEIYMLPSKSYGYAKYADESSAKAAIEALHGQEVCGVRLKVLPADPPKEEARKRKHTV